MVISHFQASGTPDDRAKIGIWTRKTAQKIPCYHFLTLAFKDVALGRIVMIVICVVAWSVKSARDCFMVNNDVIRYEEHC